MYLFAPSPHYSYVYVPICPPPLQLCEEGSAMYLFAPSPHYSYVKRVVLCTYLSPPPTTVMWRGSWTAWSTRKRTKRTCTLAGSETTTWSRSASTGSSSSTWSSSSSMASSPYLWPRCLWRLCSPCSTTGWRLDWTLTSLWSCLDVTCLRGLGI